MTMLSDDQKTLLSERFDALDADIEQLEADAQQPTHVLEQVVSKAISITSHLLVMFASVKDKAMPASDDLLEVFKAFVKGDPSLNAVRDNVRELVYYQNCIAMDRQDALPKAPARMAARTVRHIYLYLRSRSEQDAQLV